MDYSGLVAKASEEITDDMVNEVVMEIRRHISLTNNPGELTLSPSLAKKSRGVL